MGRIGHGGAQPGNAARDLARLLRRSGDLPAWEWYWVQVPLWDTVALAVRPQSIPLGLPHELVDWHLGQEATNGPSTWAPKDMPGYWEHWQGLCRTIDIDPSRAEPLSLWADGVPYTRKHSLFLINMSLRARQSGKRLPLCAIPTHLLCKCGTCSGRHTLNAVWEVLAWSLRFAALGRRPIKRHDMSDWLESDAARAAAGGQELCRPALLHVIKGDWSMLALNLGLPKWDSVLGMCWLCKATPDTFRALGSQGIQAAAMSSQEFFHQERARGSIICPLFSAPCVGTWTVASDWMHACDLGVGQDLVGGALHHCLQHLPGNSRGQRLANLWARIQDWYRANRVVTRLNALTLTMLKVPGKPAKLKSKAAECRCLQPFALHLVESCLVAHMDSEILQLLKDALGALVGLASKAHAVPWPKSEAVLEADLLVQSWVRLEPLDPDTFRVKPKVHQILHIVNSTSDTLGPPGSVWSYAEEDWGGRMVKLFVRRGGRLSVGRGAELLFNRALALA